jgi:hypothetical protein
MYIQNFPYAVTHPLIKESEENMVTFKQANEKSYARFREIMQLIDCSAIDSSTLAYKPRALVAAFMYLIIGKHINEFTPQEIFEEFGESSHYLFESRNSYNDLFSDFLLYSFGFQLLDLLPSIQYASTYFALPLNFDLPTAAKLNKENVLEVKKLLNI